MKVTAYPARNLPFEAECVAFFSDVVQVFGVPKSVGQIYGLLFASTEALCFSDIVERLDISKGSASQGLQLLRSLGAVNVSDAKRQVPSDRLKTGKSKQAGGTPPLAPEALPFALDSSLVRPLESSRRDYFEPELGLRRLMSGILQERVTPLTSAGTNRLARLRELAQHNEEADAFFLDRVKQLETWQRRLKTVLPMLSMLLGPKSKR